MTDSPAATQAVEHRVPDDRAVVRRDDWDLVHRQLDEDDDCPGRKPPFSAVERPAWAPIQKPHTKWIPYGKR